MAGHSASGVQGNKTSLNYGGSDLWVIKLGPDELTSMKLRAEPQTAADIRESGFRLELRPPGNAPTNVLYVLEASTDRTNWVAIQTNLIISGTSGIGIVDESATNRPARFYRARMER